jgi:hypothetical protein
VKKAGAFTFQLTREGIEARLGEMEKKMDRLRSMYESYFMGMERIPPNTPRRDMNRMMLEMQQVVIGNSALRFRFQSLSQKWVLQITYWNRTMRDISPNVVASSPRKKPLPSESRKTESRPSWRDSSALSA